MHVVSVLYVFNKYLLLLAFLCMFYLFLQKCLQLFNNCNPLCACLPSAGRWGQSSCMCFSHFPVLISCANLKLCKDRPSVSVAVMMYALEDLHNATLHCSLWGIMSNRSCMAARWLEPEVGADDRPQSPARIWVLLSTAAVHASEITNWCSSPVKCNAC